jgi:hypothetical protein
MDSNRAGVAVVTLRRHVARIGPFVCRLIAFCLVYSTPALSHDPHRHIAESSYADNNRLQSESLDPKHDKDHDENREGQRGYLII